MAGDYGLTLADLFPPDDLKMAAVLKDLLVGVRFKEALRRHNWTHEDFNNWLERNEEGLRAAIQRLSPEEKQRQLALCEQGLKLLDALSKAEDAWIERPAVN